MDDIQIGPLILSVIAWGCALNVILTGSVSIKQNWEVLPDAFSPRYINAGKFGIFCSMCLALYSAGWLGLLIAPVGGSFFGAGSTAIFKTNMLAWSLPLGVLTGLSSAIWLLIALL